MHGHCGLPLQSERCWGEQEVGALEQSHGDLMSSHQCEETQRRCRLRKGSLQGARAHLGPRESGRQRKGHEEGMVCGRNEQGMQAVSKRVSMVWLLKRFREQGGVAFRAIKRYSAFYLSGSAWAGNKGTKSPRAKAGGSMELPATALSSVCDLSAKTSNSEKTESQWGWDRSPGREGPVSRQVGLALEYF